MTRRAYFGIPSRVGGKPPKYGKEGEKVATISKGEKVTCPSCKRVVCEVAEDIKPGALMGDALFTGWQQSKARPGQRLPLMCAECGAGAYLIQDDLGFHVHTEGRGFVPPIYPPSSTLAGVTPPDHFTTLAQCLDWLIRLGAVLNAPSARHEVHTADSALTFRLSPYDVDKERPVADCFIQVAAQRHAVSLGVLLEVSVAPNFATAAIDDIRAPEGLRYTGPLNAPPTASAGVAACRVLRQFIEAQAQRGAN